MEKYLEDFIDKIRLGEIISYENLAIIPVFAEGNGHYITLKEAMDLKVLTVKEVSESGSVPELKVINMGDKDILLLDGEELTGAKQNRVLNTTVLIGAKSEVIIPVSCTEQGRWSYTSHEFKDSDVMMAYNIKRKKARSVMMNIRTTGTYRSNQSEVWDDIEDLSRNAGVHSRTSAMKDVFESKEKDINDYIKAFNAHKDQNGLMVFINGELMGFDVISSKSAYSVLHPKLIKSSAIEAILVRKKDKKEPDASYAHMFLKDITTCTYTKHKSVGLGWDIRFEGKQKVGSALINEDNVIHMAFFTIDEAEQTGNISGLSRRRSYRRSQGD